MATTSSNLTAGPARAGQGGKGKGNKRRAAGLVATAVLGLGLLIGVALGQARQEAPPAAPQANGNPIVNEAGYRPNQFTSREDHRASTTTPVVPAPPTYRESHGLDGTSVVADRLTTPTYRESHGLDRTPAGVARFLPSLPTYRESHGLD